MQSGNAFQVIITETGGNCNSDFFNCPGSNEQVGSETSCSTSATTFTIDTFGYMHIGTTNILATQQVVGNFNNLRFLPPQDVFTSDFYAVTCKIVGTVLSCVGSTGNSFYEVFEDVYLGDPATDSNATPFTGVNVVFV
jgi:hypothetical protein